MIHWLGGITLAYAATSMLWSRGSAWSLVWLASYAGAYAVGWCWREQRILWIAYAWAALAFFIFAYAVEQSEYGSFGSNWVGAIVGSGIAAALIADQVWLSIGLLIPLIWTQSRGALAAAAVIFGLTLHRKAPWLLWFLLLACLGGIAASTNLKVGDGMFIRFGIWQDTLNHMTLWGAGFGSFMAEYASWPLHRNLTGLVALHPYNDFLELTFELGLGVIPLLVAICLALEARTPQRLFIVFVICLGVTFFPLSIVPIGHLFFLVLGTLARERKPYGSMETLGRPLPRRAWD